ncbi:MAG: DUF4149 domain-containing protein [Thioalkalivibrio sp.]|nr:DUF4149 domain-containing protein [Thioalkalivibrio sp.]
MQSLTTLIAGLALALTFGGMTFFSAVMAPLVFTKLPAETAGAFIRAVFPWYYLTLGATTLVALLALLPGSADSTPWEAILTALILLGFVYARQVLMPRINLARDAELAGEQDAGRRFQRLHRISVAVNAVQWLAALLVLAMVLA